MYFTVEILPPHHTHMNYGRGMTRLYQSSLSHEHPIYTYCGHYIYMSPKKQQKLILYQIIFLEFS
jgi:hypothetical protein